MKALYALTPEEHATVLGALRHYQRDMSTAAVEQIEQLIQSLNHHGLEFGEVVNLIGVDEDNPYVAAAHEHRLLSEGTLEVDPKTITRESDEGAYVMAWLWVSNEDAGVASEEA